MDIKDMIKEVVTYTFGMKQGEFYQMEDTMSCNIIKAIVKKVNDNNVVMMNLRTFEDFVIDNGDIIQNRYVNINKLELIASKPEINYANDKIENVKKEPTKKECERATDEYEKHLKEKIKESKNEKYNDTFFDYKNFNYKDENNRQVEQFRNKMKELKENNEEKYYKFITNPINMILYGNTMIVD